jgi:hypothetical protein
MLITARYAPICSWRKDKQVNACHSLGTGQDSSSPVPTDVPPLKGPEDPFKLWQWVKEGPTSEADVPLTNRETIRPLWRRRVTTSLVHILSQNISIHILVPLRYSQILSRLIRTLTRSLLRVEIQSKILSTFIICLLRFTPSIPIFQPSWFRGCTISGWTAHILTPFLYSSFYIPTFHTAVTAIACKSIWTNLHYMVTDQASNQYEGTADINILRTIDHFNCVYEWEDKYIWTRWM